MAKLKKGSFPGIARQAKQSQSEGAITENIEILTGQRGNGENRALLVKDLVNLDDMKRRALINNANGGGAGNLPIGGGGGVERPHAPVNLTGTGGFTFIALTWDHPTYRGHAYAEVWRSETDSFSSATLIATEVTDIFSDSVNMGTGYYYWVRFVNVADMKGPTQGAKGLYVETQKSAEQILGEIGGLIEKSHLGAFLTSEIDEIPQLSDSIKTAEAEVEVFRQRVEAVDAQTDSLARQLIDAALLGDKNWESNTLKLVSLETEVGDVKAKIDSEFFTMAEATEAIAAATQTIRAEIEDSGISLSGNISETYFTKAGTNEAIAAYGQTLKSQIEDPNGTSIGAVLKTDYYTKASTDEAISEATTAMASTVTTDVNAAVDAKLTQSYYTKSDVDGAISESATLIISEIQNPDGEGLGSILFNNYQTKTDAKETEANLVQQLNSAYTEASQAVIENALANDVSEERKTAAEADIVLQQKTLANEQEAIANSLFTMRADLGDSSAKLSQLQQVVSTNANAVARNVLKLSSNIGETNREVERVDADLQINYSTTADTEKAISDATTQLKSTIENPDGNSVGANLYKNYYTKSSTDSAISTASQILKSQIEDANGNSIGASLQTLSQTVASNEGDFSALWGVKTNVNGLQSSLGLVNDGVEPIFAVKGAKFAIITDQDPTNLTPVFAVTGGKTVINTAIIDQAFIKSLVTDDLLSNRVLVGSRFTSPSINYNPANGARSNNFSIDPGGNMLAKSATLESVTIKDNNGNIVMSSTGAIPSSKVTGLGALAAKNSVSYGEVTGKPALGSLAYLNSLAYDSITGKPSLGPFAGLSKILSSNVTTYIANGAIGSAQIDQAYINQLFGQNASFYGTVYAQNLDGDVIDLAIKDVDQVHAYGNDEVEVVRFTVSSQPFQRKLMIDGIRVTSTAGLSNSPYAILKLYMSGYSTAVDTVSRGGSGVSQMLLATIPANSSRTVYVKISVGRGTSASAITQRIVARVFKEGSTIS